MVELFVFEGWKCFFKVSGTMVDLLVRTCFSMACLIAPTMDSITEKRCYIFMNEYKDAWRCF